MAKADDEGIPFEDYIKLHEPEPRVRTKLDRGELRYTWVDADGNARASDDGGPQPPKGWWGMVETTKFDREQSSVRGLAFLEPAFGEMFFVKVYPAVTVTDAPADEHPAATNSSAAPVPKLTGKAWVPVAYGRRAKELLAMTITEASVVLAEASKTAPDCAKPLKARYIERLLRDLNVFPKKSRYRL